MPRCITCKVDKTDTDFAFHSIATGKRQTRCRACHAIARRAHYVRNPETYIRREVTRINKHRIDNRASMLAYLLAHPCVDCGETDPVKLDFDHRDPAQKRGNVGELAMRKPWRLVCGEIAKCDVRCANCHLKRTARQFKWRKVDGHPIVAGAWLARQVPTNGSPASQARIPGEMKRCTSCGLERSTAEFAIKDKKTGRRGTWCRACRSAYAKVHYEENREKYKSRTRAPRHKQRDPYWYWLMSYLTSHPCVDCGEANPVVLQFDHRDGTMKVDAVGTMVNRASWTILLREVAKCDVRCANCHRLRTAQQFNWSKWIRESA